MRIALEHFTKRFGSVTVIEDMNLVVESGEMLALLGPSGCGKSTTLFAICGIHRLDEGRLLFGDRDMTTVPSQRRNVGVVFQSYALYPHMSVFDNIAFPLRVRKDAKAQVAAQVREIAELVHIVELLERKPAQLSGGQQQRVALARALVRRPDILLLDEPLANLDAKLRLEMRSEIKRIQRETGITAVLVTHDQVEAMSMCDRIAMMNEGEIAQLAEPEEMYKNPISEFVAGFLGNPPIAFLEARIANGRCLLHATGQTLPLRGPLSRLEEGERVRIGIRPEHFRPDLPDKLEGTVAFVEPQGRECLYEVVLGKDADTVRPVLRSIQDSAERSKVGGRGCMGYLGRRPSRFRRGGGQALRAGFRSC